MAFFNTIGIFQLQNLIILPSHKYSSYGMVHFISPYHSNKQTNKQTNPISSFLNLKKIKIKTQQLNPQNLDSRSISLNLPISLSTSFLSSFSLTKHLPITLSIPSIPTCQMWILRIHEEDKRQQSIYTVTPTNLPISSFPLLLFAFLSLPL